ncbi:MAG: penicillin-binding protein activator [Rickettsiales bacterium]|nr:penicillin-binding protein activator [Rickettsiales bacterium]
MFKLYKKIIFVFTAVLLFSCSSDLDYFLNNDKIKEGQSTFYTDSVMDEYTKTSSDKLRVAVLVPLSGQVKSVGESILNSIQLSLFENNKKNIVLKVYDTKGTTFGAVEAINRAIKDGIDTVIGPLFSAETKAIKNIIKKHDLIVFSLSNDDELKGIDNVFVTGSIPEQEIQTLISYMMENDFINYVALMPNSSHGAAMNKILRGTILNKDGLLIKTEYYDQDEKNLMTKISDLANFYEVPQTLYEDYEKKKMENKLLGNNEELEFIIQEDEKIYPQALFIPDGGKKAEEIANLLFINQRNGRYIQLLGTTKLDGDTNVLNNPYLDNVIFIGANPEKYKKFYDSYVKLYRSEPSKITSMTYDLVNIIDKVYYRADGIYSINKKELLNPNGFDGIDGKFRFLPNGVVERKMFVLQLQNKEKVVLSTDQEFLNY